MMAIRHVRSSFQLGQLFKTSMEKKTMKKLLTAVSASALLVMSGATFAADATAQTKPAAAPAASTATASSNSMSIGVVNIRQVLQSSPQIAAMNDQLKKQFQSRQDQITTAQNQLKADQDNLAKNSATMKAADQTALQSKIDTEGKQLTQMQMSFQQDVIDRKSTRLNSSHIQKSRMPSSA